MSKCTYTVEEQGKTVKSVQSDSPKEGDSTKPTDDTPTPIVNIDGIKLS